ncbi:CAP domain-containing protein [Sinomonas sp. P10A9]|uniref:CAP domain-containing protein n=1 Tax=Sinomonas puerhi TaxID=3238584 RepID=A0AB39L1U6_9MICC
MRRVRMAVAVVATALLTALAPAAAPPSSVLTTSGASRNATHDVAPSPTAAGAQNAATNRSLDVRLDPAGGFAQGAAGPQVKPIDALRGPDTIDPSVTSVTPLAAPMGDTSNLVSDDNSSQVLAVFSAINAYRQQNGLNPVRYHLNVQELAQEWSDSIASREVIEHRSSFWTDPRALNPDNGAGEVIAVRWDRDATQLVEWWKSSPSHNAILLDARMSVVGIGITFTNGTPATTPNRYTMWGVVDFFGYKTLPAGTTASPGGASTSPSPSPTPAQTPTTRPAPVPVNPPSGTPLTPAGAELCAAPGRFQPTTQDLSHAALHSAADLVALDPNGSVLVYPAASGGALGAPTTIGTGFGNAASVTSVDWDRDGVFDLLVQWRDGRLVVYPGLTGGSFAAPVTLGQSGWDTMTLASGLWCATNRLPQLLALDPSGNLYFYPNRGTGDLFQRALLATGVAGGHAAMLDVTGDGFEDFVAQGADGTLVLYRSLGQEQLVSEARAVVASAWGTTGQLQVLRGLDGPGTLGIAAVRTNGSLGYWPVTGGQFGAPRVLGAGWGGMRLG